MGFMDKLKDVGKGALKGTLAMASTSYGSVVSGKHKLCKIGMNSTYDTLVFIKVAAIEEECVIKDTIKTFTVHSDDNARSYHTIDLEFNNGETCEVLIAVDTNKGSALPTAEQRIAAHYKEGALLVRALAQNVPEMSDDTKQWVNKIMRFANQPEFK